MEYFSVIMIALGLSVDSFAVSVSYGLVNKKLAYLDIFKTIVVFGSFQGIMPILGWFVGSELKGFITEIDHWIAFSLLAGIGVKMILESTKECKCEAPSNHFELKNICLLGIATSIDALAVGIGFAFLEIQIVSASIIIALTTVIISWTGLIIGNKVGHFFEKGIQIFGGLVLIGIGVKILIEHLS